jgi:hypothetical protein
MDERRRGDLRRSVTAVTNVSERPFDLLFQAGLDTRDYSKRDLASVDFSAGTGTLRSPIGYPFFVFLRLLGVVVAPYLNESSIL